MRKSPMNGEDLIRTATAARILGVSSETIRGWANAGRLRVTKTSDGMRLFYRSDCEQLCRRRAAQRDGADARTTA